MVDAPPRALEDRGLIGARMFSPSAARNRDAIRDAFASHMPAAGRFLEIGAGSGEHVVHLAASMPAARFTPSDPDAAARASIAGWIAESGLASIEAPIAIDLSSADWPTLISGRYDGVYACNVLHISPFAATAGLFSGAASLLGPGGRLFLYGPFARDGVHISESNAAFDRTLKDRNPDWGVRDLERDLAPLAAGAAFALCEIVSMPANNLSIIFEKR